MKFVNRALHLIQTLRKERAIPVDRERNLATSQPIDTLATEKISPSVPDLVQTEALRQLNTADEFIAEALNNGSDPLANAVRLTDGMQLMFTELAKKASPSTPLNVTTGRTIREPNFPARVLDRQPAAPSYYRWRASTHDLCLSVRATASSIELFMMKADDIALLSFSEFGSRRKAGFEQSRLGTKSVWTANKVPLTLEMVNQTLQDCLQQLLAGPVPEEEGTIASKVGERANSPDSVQQLMLEKENLIFKVLNQQETIKNELARSLHDTVLADLLMLKRHMRGDQELSKEEVIETIDEISQQLRDICNECAPRNLHDWGLKVSIQDLLNRFGQRTAIETRLVCEIEIPNLPDVVELHIFRLIQESLNNIEKHARAKEVNILIECPAVHAPRAEHAIRFRIVDNGQGFSEPKVSQSTDSGGMGLTGMRERAQLVRCFYPTTFSIESQPGKGTTVTLELTVQG